MRHLVLFLAVLHLAACVGYNNRDHAVGPLKALSSLRQLQGTYLAYAQEDVERNARFPEYTYNGLTNAFRKRQTWPAHVFKDSGFVRILYENEQQFRVQVWDNAGKMLVEQDYRSPKDFTLEDGELRWFSYSSDITSDTTDILFTLNARGNLVQKTRTTSIAPWIGILQRTIEYREYRRVQ